MSLPEMHRPSVLRAAADLLGRESRPPAFLAALIIDGLWRIAAELDAAEAIIGGPWHAAELAPIRYELTAKAWKAIGLAPTVETAPEREP